MKKSGLEPAEDDCQVPVAVNRSVCSVPVNACDRLIIHDCDDRSGLEIRDYFVLLFSADKFVGHNPLCFVSAAVIGECRLNRTVMVMVVTLTKAAGCTVIVDPVCILFMAAAVISDRVNGQCGYCFVSTAMETCMMNQGKAETTRQHESDQEY